jgi:hypothetical protein
VCKIHRQWNILSVTALHQDIASRVNISPRGEERMIKTIILSICLAVSSLSLNAHAQNAHPQDKRDAQDKRGFSYGPVTEVGHVHVNYGHFDEYMAWITSTWVPTMEAAKKAGLIIGYKVVIRQAQQPTEPNLYTEITFKDMASFAADLGDPAAQDAFEAVTEKVICSSACQDQARVNRNAIRTFLGSEIIREIVFK